MPQDMPPERRKIKARQIDETTDAIERLIDCVGRVLDEYDANPHDLVSVGYSLDELRKSFNDVLEKLRRSAL